MKHSNNPVLNEIFTINNIPLNYPKQLDAAILSAIKLYNKKKYTKDIFFNNYGIISETRSDYNPFIIPSHFFK